MKNYFKKFSVMFVMAFAIMLGTCISAFADNTSQSIKINNTTLNFNKIIYIDGTNGNDTTGDGSQLKPFNTLLKATSAVNTDNTLIYILTPGTYASPNGLQGLLSSNYTVTYATPSSNFGNVIIDLETTASNGKMVMNKLNKFIGLNFIRSMGGDNRIFEYFLDPATVNLEFDNCTFLKSPAITSPVTYIFTGNSVGCKVTELTYNNCSFLQHMSWTDSNYNSMNIHTSVNSAFIDSDPNPKAFNLFNAQFDANYNITSNGWENTGTGTNSDGTQANIGVYGGAFAWGTQNIVQESITLDKSTIDLNVSDSRQLTATTTPAGAQVTWSSSDSTVATVDSTGKVTGVKEGQATITAITADGVAATCTVTVINGKSISLNKPVLDLITGDSETLIATTTPSGANVKWSSSDTSIATVDSSGRVTAIGVGTATITATTMDGSNLSASSTINVTPKGTEPIPEQTDSDKIVNIAHAKGDNTNNAGGGVTIIFKGIAEAQLSVVKTADVDSVYVGDVFTYTIVVTNTSTKTAKAVVASDTAPNHIDFNVSGITTTQGKVDPSSTSKNIIVNIGDIPPSGKVTIKIPATVIL